MSAPTQATNLEPDLELPTAILCDRQNKLKTAHWHWSKARQLYKNHDRDREWTKTTRKLAQSYRELGNLSKARPLLQELEYSTSDLD